MNTKSPGPSGSSRPLVLLNYYISHLGRVIRLQVLSDDYHNDVSTAARVAHRLADEMLAARDRKETNE